MEEKEIETIEIFAYKLHQENFLKISIHVVIERLRDATKSMELKNKKRKLIKSGRKIGSVDSHVLIVTSARTQLICDIYALSLRSATINESRFRETCSVAMGE